MKIQINAMEPPSKARGSSSLSPLGRNPDLSRPKRRDFIRGLSRTTFFSSGMPLKAGKDWVSNIRIKKIFILFNLFILTAAFAIADDFSADVFIKSERAEFRGKCFYTEKKVRIDTGETISITRLDKNLLWLLIPEREIYVESPLPYSSGPVIEGKIPGEISRQLIREEGINGQLAKKYRIEYLVGNKTMVVYAWLADNLKIPIKVVSEDGSWYKEHTNIKKGRQPDDLFEIPAGYQKFSPQASKISGLIKGIWERIKRKIKSK